MRLYIAGPMTGLPEFNYPAFHVAAEQLGVAGYDVLNPADIDKAHNSDGAKQAWDWYMRHALRMVLDADGIALLYGWQNSRGAALEYKVGCALQLDVRLLSQWVNPPKKAAS